MRFDRETGTLHAGGRTWTVDPRMTSIEDIEIPGMSPMRQRAVVVRFESGWAASIIWGRSTYSSNHDYPYEETEFYEEPELVEVGVLDRTGNLRMRRFDDEDGHVWHDVEAYVDDEALVELLDRLRDLPTDYDYGDPPPTIEEVTEQMTAYFEMKAGEP